LICAFVTLQSDNPCSSRNHQLLNRAAVAIFIEFKGLFSLLLGSQALVTPLREIVKETT